jgi:tetratricopeptide (TPR) repeat protein
MNQEEARARAIETYYEGYRFQSSGRLAEALSRYRQSIKLFPTAEAHTHLAWILGTQGKIRDAIEECYKAIALDPDYGNPYNDIGYFLIESGHYGEAIPWLEKALKAKRYDHFAFPHFNLARCYEKLGPWTAALEEYRKAIEITPDFEAACAGMKRLQATLN